MDMKVLIYNLLGFCTATLLPFTIEPIPVPGSSVGNVGEASNRTRGTQITLPVLTTSTPHRL
jgi:hypothetical protein